MERLGLHARMAGCYLDSMQWPSHSTIFALANEKAVAAPFTRSSVSLLPGPKAGPHARSQPHVLLALRAFGDKPCGKLGRREDRRVGQLGLQQGLSGGVAVRKVDALLFSAAIAGSMRKSIRRWALPGWGASVGNRGDIEPHDSAFPGNAVADPHAVGRDPGALLRLHGIAVARDMMHSSPVARSSTREPLLILRIYGRTANNAACARASFPASSLSGARRATPVSWVR